MSDRPFPSPREPPEDPSLHVREVDLATMLQPQYWREICPSLHVCDEAFQGSVRPMRGAELEDVAADARERSSATATPRSPPRPSRGRLSHTASSRWRACD
jgi:hypothetical protein